MRTPNLQSRRRRKKLRPTRWREKLQSIWNDSV